MVVQRETVDRGGDESDRHDNNDRGFRNQGRRRRGSGGASREAADDAAEPRSSRPSRRKNSDHPRSRVGGGGSEGALREGIVEQVSWQERQKQRRRFRSRQRKYQQEEKEEQKYRDQRRESKGAEGGGSGGCDFGDTTNPSGSAPSKRSSQPKRQSNSRPRGGRTAGGSNQLKQRGDFGAAVRRSKVDRTSSPSNRSHRSVQTTSSKNSVSSGGVSLNATHAARSRAKDRAYRRGHPQPQQSRGNLPNQNLQVQGSEMSSLKVAIDKYDVEKKLRSSVGAKSSLANAQTSPWGSFVERRRSGGGSKTPHTPDPDPPVTKQRTAEELKTRRYRGRMVSLRISHDDGSVEMESPLPYSVCGGADPCRVYRSMCSIEPCEGEGIGENKRGSNEGTENRETEAKASKGASTSIGSVKEPLSEEKGSCDNGWHRVGGLTLCPPSRKGRAAVDRLERRSAARILEQLHPQLDECDAVNEEYYHLTNEIEALEQDRVWLEERFNEAAAKDAEEEERRRESRDQEGLMLTKAGATVCRIPWMEDLPLNLEKDEIGMKSPGPICDRELTRRLPRDVTDTIRHGRGTSLAIMLNDPDAKHALVGRCYVNSGRRMNASILGTQKRLLRNMVTDDGVGLGGNVTLLEEGGDCVQFLSITGTATISNASESVPGGSGQGGTTYFVKFDGGNTYHRGPLPSRLVDRMVREDREAKSLRYLSTGSMQGCYYAEFDNGECWWGTTASENGLHLTFDDDKLHHILMELDVHRIAWGGSNPSTSSWPLSARSRSSWVVVGKDGSVAWRNIPWGLHETLVSRESEWQQRNQPHPAAPLPPPAPCEVSLGRGETFFVRFLDGTMDYSLPAFVADACDRLIDEGKVIRNVALHVDTHDCLIRYSSVTGAAAAGPLHTGTR